MRSLAPSSDVLELQVMVAWRVRILRSGQIRSAAERISSKNNKWADLGSRGRIEEVLKEVKEMGLAAKRWRIDQRDRLAERQRQTPQ